MNSRKFAESDIGKVCKKLKSFKTSSFRGYACPVEEYDVIVTWVNRPPREGVGQLPALLLDRGQLPLQLTLDLRGGRSGRALRVAKEGARLRPTTHLRHTHPQHDGETLEHRHQVHDSTARSAGTGLMFLVIYVDYFALYKPGFIDDILAGRVYEFAIGPTFVTLGFTVIAIPSLMILLSMTLPARVNRAANLVVASLNIPVMIFNAAGESWTY